METSEEPERAPSSPTLKGLLQSMEEDEALGEVENGAQLDFFFGVFSDKKITPTWRPKKLWVFGDPRDGPFRPSSSFQEEFFHHRVRLILVCQQHLQYPTVSFDVVRHTIPMSEVSFDTTVFFQEQHAAEMDLVLEHSDGHLESGPFTKKYLPHLICTK